MAQSEDSHKGLPGCIRSSSFGYRAHAEKLAEDEGTYKRSSHNSKPMKP